MSDVLVFLYTVIAGEGDARRKSCPYFTDNGVRRILARGVNAPLPPEANKILKI